MIISAIVAQDKNRVIGKNNELPWYLPADLKYFMKTTLGHHIIMGRKCFESIGKPLKKRTNIILTRNPFYVVSSCIVCSSLEEALTLSEINGEEEVFIVGGGEVYNEALPFCDKIYLTEVDLEIKGNNEELVYFPKVDKAEWDLISEEKNEKDEKNEYDFSFLIYERKKEL